MPIRDEYTRLPVASIKVDRAGRQRQNVEIDSLKHSIAARGVMNPIIVERRGNEIWLIAGERRLEASRALTLADIPVRFADSLSPLELQLIELEENLKRRDLHWTEMVEGVLRVHELYQETHGEGWTIERSAEQLSINAFHVKKMYRVARQLREEKAAGVTSTAECPNWTGAFERLQRLTQRAKSDALEQLLDDEEGIDLDEQSSPPGVRGALQGLGEGLPQAAGSGVAGGGASVSGGQFGPLIRLPRVVLKDLIPPQRSSNAAPRPKAEEVLNEDFVKWSETYAGPKFNLIHVDFPYGVDVFHGLNRSRVVKKDFEYEDKPEVFTTLLEAFLANGKNFISSSAHLVFWMNADILQMGEVIRRFNTALPQFEFYPKPLVWHKSDNSGMFPKPNLWPRHTHELAMLATSAGRNIVQMVADSYSGPPNNTIHPSAKPAPMLGHFFRMLVDNSTRLLDPTCGSGTALQVADALGAAQVLGLEVDKAMCNSARMGLKLERERRKGPKEMDI